MVEPVFGRWGPTEVMERVLDGTWAEVVDGMGLIEPTSVTFSGTSAAITGLGSVEFSAVTSLSLNGVFSSDFDNYIISMRHTASNTTQLFYRLRASGTDNSTVNSYTYQYLQADGTTVNGARTTADAGWCGYGGSSQREGHQVFVYGPNLAQPTALRSVSALGLSGARILDNASTHNQSTAYDGITIYPNSPQTMSGRVAMYGMVK